MVIDTKARFAWRFIVMSLIAFALTVAAQDPGQPVDPRSYGMTLGRSMATAAAVIALIGVIIGGLALLRPAGRFGTSTGRLGAIVALAGGLIGTVVGAMMAATSGGVGTGGGKAGAIVALVLGVISEVLGALALSRSRRT